MKVGITSTRTGLSIKQKIDLRAELVRMGATELSHGDCVGGDSDAHDIARDLGLKISIHPPSDSKLRAWRTGDVIYEPKPYIARNHDIVDTTDRTIGLPKEREEQLRGSGTWATIRYAKKKFKLHAILHR